MTDIVNLTMIQVVTSKIIEIEANRIKLLLPVLGYHHSVYIMPSTT